MSLKILHTSDIHLGMKFSAYPEVQAELTEARFRTLERLVTLSNKKGCDLFVISGDLFDRTSVAKKDIVEAARILKEFQGRLTVVLPGNHDYIIKNQTDLWKVFREHMADNTLLLDERKTYDLEHYDINACLYACPCFSKHSEENGIGWIIEADRTGRAYHIGIAHGSLEGFSPDFERRYYPMTLDELERANLDIWLLGHTHIPYPQILPQRFQGPNRPASQTDRIFYPGTPEPDGFDCDHRGTAWLIVMEEDRGINATLLETGRYRFLHEDVEINGIEDVDTLKSRYQAEESRNILLKLRLSGRIHRDELYTIREHLRELRSMFFYLNLNDDELTEKITPEVISQEFSEDSFPYLILSKLVDDPEALQIAYEIIQEVRR